MGRRSSSVLLLAVRARRLRRRRPSDSFASICRGPLRGWLRFHGSNGGPFFLEEIHFLAGVRTDRGIGLGATRAEVRRAYGRSLLRRKRSTALMVLAGRRRGASERDATVFAFRGGRVDQIVFGLRSDLAESRRPDSFTPRCR